MFNSRFGIFANKTPQCPDGYDFLGSGFMDITNMGMRQYHQMVEQAIKSALTSVGIDIGNMETLLKQSRDEAVGFNPLNQALFDKGYAMEILVKPTVDLTLQCIVRLWKVHRDYEVSVQLVPSIIDKEPQS